MSMWDSLFHFFSPQGADIPFYMDKAQICAGGGDCWTPRHCFGFIFYASIPYRMGWRPEASILMGLSLVLISVVLAAKAMEVLLPSLAGRGFVFNLAKYGVIAMAHLVFMWGPVHGFAADTPAACTSLIALWTFVLACKRNSAWILALSGLVMGCAFALRNTYIYPAYFFIPGCLWAVFWLKRITWQAMAGFLIMLSLPILSQYALTYRHEGAWSALDPGLTAQYTATELTMLSNTVDIPNQDPAYGCDGIGVDHIYWYTCHDCLNGPPGWSAVLSRGDFFGLAKLLWLKQEFYFGSYIFQPCLENKDQRIWSNWILLANACAMLAVGYFFVRVRERWILGMLLSYLGGVWVLFTVLHPETRYMMPVDAFLWSAGPLFLLSLLPSHRGARP
jgi:hypothetical protein